MGIYAKDNLTRYAYQSRTPETKSYSYDLFQVVEIDTDFNTETRIYYTEEWEFARQFWIKQQDLMDRINEEECGGHPVIQLRIEGLVYN